MINYEEQAGNVLAELEEAEKLTMDSGAEEIYSFTQKCGEGFSIVCC